jgi:hypothetical protein
MATSSNMARTQELKVVGSIGTPFTEIELALYGYLSEKLAADIDADVGGYRFDKIDGRELAQTQEMPAIETAQEMPAIDVAILTAECAGAL